MGTSLVIAAVVFALAGALLLAAAFGAVRRRRIARSMAACLVALLLLALAALAGTLSAATQGYRALTREEVAAVVSTESLGPQRLRATFRYPDGRRASFELQGDGLSIEAHIVKWHPLANVLGLHTAYRLSRVAGRYDRLADEQARPRTVHALAPPALVDVFALAQRLAFLGPLIDAQYGSATFLSTPEPAQLELRVSTSGLLFRPIARRSGGRQGPGLPGGTAGP